MEVLKNQVCPFCRKKELTLTEDVVEVPYFGKVFLFSMQCDNCHARQSDVEAEQSRDPCKITFEIQDEKDLKVRVVKSSHASVKIPQMRITATPGEASEGYVSNIEGLLSRFEKVIDEQKDLAEDEAEKRTAKNLLKKLRKVKFGDVKLKIIIEDPSGNSAIISERALVERMKVRK